MRLDQTSTNPGFAREWPYPSPRPRLNPDPDALPHVLAILAMPLRCPRCIIRCSSEWSRKSLTGASWSSSAATALHTGRPLRSTPSCSSGRCDCGTPSSSRTQLQGNLPEEPSAACADVPPPPLPFFSCARLRRTVPQLACVWSSSIGALQLHVRSQAISPRFRCPSHVTAPSRPNNQGLCNRKHWDLRFYFYHVRKALVARLAAAVRCWALALVSSSGLSGPARAAIVREVHLLDPKARARAAKGGGAWHLAPSQLCAHRRLTTA